MKSQDAGFYETLLAAQPYDSPQDGQENLFEQALLEELRFHYENNALYRKFCQRKGFDPSQYDGALSSIPYVATQVFKELGQELNSVQKDKIRVSLESSATSGKASTVLIDKVTSRRQVQAMVKIVGDFLGKERRPFFIFDLDPKTQDPRDFGARGAAIRGYLNFASSAEYFVDFDEQGEFRCLEDSFRDSVNSHADEPVVLFGFTYVFYSSFIQPMLAAGKSFQLPPGSKVIHIGGWKKLESIKVAKDQFNREVSQVLGIEPTDVIDIYGFTEQMGLNYPDCPAGWKHVPRFCEVLVRDPATMEVCEDGVPGALQFISPLPHSYPGNSVITDDLGMIDKDPASRCECGRVGRRFQILGRLKKAEVRGCGDVLADKLLTEQAAEAVCTNEQVSILSYGDGSLVGDYPDAQCLSGLVDELARAQDWLQAQPVDALIGLIDMARQRWMAPESALGKYREHGLGFLDQWCRAEHLRELADFSLRGQRGYLDTFRPLSGSTARMLRANPRGLICHWLSGNVPILGMLTLVQAILTKNVNLLKSSSEYSDVLPLILDAFRGLVFESPGGMTVKGDDLLKTIAIVYFDKSNAEAGRTLSLNANSRIVWGGQEAVSAISGLPRAYTTEDIIFGPKLSYMVVSRDFLDTERRLKKICRRAATDVSSFDQSACASPHTIFVEKGGELSPEAFAQKLADELDKALVRIPKDYSRNDVNVFNSLSSIYDFTGRVWKSDLNGWMVLLDDKCELASPHYHRIITVRPVDSIMDAAEFASEDIQTVGLAAQGSERLAFAERVTANGVERCPDIGRMTNFEMPWDGTIVIDRLVRWSTLGGPL